MRAGIVKLNTLFSTTFLAGVHEVIANRLIVVLLVLGYVANGDSENCR
jgi:hypothetical protein